MITETTTIEKVRLLSVQFDLPISFNEIPSFRGAIVEKVGREHILFHQHLEANKDLFRYQYPKIQYKRIKGKACIICIDDAVEEIHNLFQQSNWEIDLNGKPCTLQIDQLRVHEHKLLILDRPIEYHINDWIALNKHNYQKYQAMESDEEKLALLNKLLASHIISFGRGLQRRLPRFEVMFDTLPKTNIRYLKGTPLMTFSGTFKTDLTLPSYIGIGKSSSKGYGMISRKRRRKTVISDEI